MPTIGDRYVLGAGRSDHDRLKVISDIHDLRTRELLAESWAIAGDAATASRIEATDKDSRRVPMRSPCR